MKHEFLIRNGSPRLIILFAGWGMDSRPFGCLQPAGGYDLAVVWDYRTLQLEADLSGYGEVCIVAWSYGVSMASIWLDNHRELPVTRRVAVCGTLYPVDESRGIPEAVFRATMENLNDTTLRKFYQRMVGGRKAFDEFKSVMPLRDVAELREELESIERYASEAGERNIHHWDTVIVSDTDYVIPTANQLKGWEGHRGVRVVAGSHYPDFGQILQLPVCKEDVSRSFAASMATYEENASVQHKIARRLSEIWGETGFVGGNGDVVEFGAGTGLFTREYIRFVRPHSLRLMDIARMPDSLPGEKIVGDAEIAIRMIADESVDAIVTASTVQWFNSIGRFLKECGRVLRPGGMVVMSTFGPDNYKELSHIIRPGVNYTSADELKALVPDGIEILALESESIVLGFESARELVEHMRLTGVTGSGMTGSARTAGALGVMRENIRSLTYNPVYMLLLKRPD